MRFTKDGTSNKLTAIVRIDGEEDSQTASKLHNDWLKNFFEQTVGTVRVSSEIRELMDATFTAVLEKDEVIATKSISLCVLYTFEAEDFLYSFGEVVGFAIPESKIWKKIDGISTVAELMTLMNPKRGFFLSLLRPAMKRLINPSFPIIPLTPYYPLNNVRTEQIQMKIEV